MPARNNHIPRRPTLETGIETLCGLARTGDAIRGARISLIARNPHSPMAQLVWNRLGMLFEAGINTYAIFASLDGNQGGPQALGKFAAIYGEGAAEAQIRLLNGSLTRKVREQAIVSQSGVWIGSVVGSGAGLHVEDGQYICFDDGFLGQEHAEAARRGFAGAFRTARPLSKSGLLSAPLNWGRAISSALGTSGSQAA